MVRVDAGSRETEEGGNVRPDLYHPWSPDVGQMLHVGSWQVGCVPPREMKVEVTVPPVQKKGRTAFAEWLKGVSQSESRMRVPGEIITMGENVCSCYICTCGCYNQSRGGMQYFIEKREGVFVHDFCGESVE